MIVGYHIVITCEHLCGPGQILSTIEALNQIQSITRAVCPHQPTVYFVVVCEVSPLASALPLIVLPIITPNTISLKE